MASGSTYSNGTTGGSATHKITINEMPSHQHQLPYCGNDVSDGSTNQQPNFIYGKGQTANAIGQKSEIYNADVNYDAEGDELAYNTAWAGANSNTTGRDKSLQANNDSMSIMPPYLAVYI